MGQHTIIVSDLHVDYWTDKQINGKSRLQHFCDFLDWCKQRRVRELIINGDLLDLPPYQSNVVFADNPELCAGPRAYEQDGRRTCIAREAVEKLIEFGREVPVTYVYGNHDIGISGFRCMGADNIAGLEHINFCYPNYVVNYYGSTVLVEHGHFYDPFLWLYLRDLSNRTYEPWEFEKYNWRMQRRNPKTGAKLHEAPGIPGDSVNPIQVTPGTNAYETVRQAQSEESIDLGAIIKWSKQFAKDLTTSVVDIPKRSIWWAAALHKMKNYSKQAGCSGKLYQVFGHTHRAFIGEKDKGVGVDQDGVECFYFNSGGWTEDTNEGWYLDIDETGKVWLQDWINEPDELKTLAPANSQ